MIYKHSSGGVIIDHGKVLTISWTTHEYVTFPKGGIDEGETSEQAALREVLEETGYKARIVAPIGSWTYDFDKNGQRNQKQVDYYLMELASEDEPTPHREQGEDFENLWLDVETAKKRLSFDDAREALDKAAKIRL